MTGAMVAPAANADLRVATYAIGGSLSFLNLIFARGDLFLKFLFMRKKMNFETFFC